MTDAKEVLKKMRDLESLFTNAGGFWQPGIFKGAGDVIEELQAQVATCAAMVGRQSTRIVELEARIAHLEKRLKDAQGIIHKRAGGRGK